MRYILLLTLALVLMVPVVTYSADTPTMVRVPDLEERVNTIKATLRQYREVDGWSGTFRIDKVHSKKMLDWIEADSKSKQKVNLPPWSCLFSVDVSKNRTAKLTLGILDKDGNVVPPVKTGNENDPELRELLILVQQMVFATEVGDHLDYYAGNKTGETEEEVWVGISATGWTSYQLSKAMGDLPTRIEYGDYSPIPADYKTLSDFRKEDGRWSARKMTDTMLVPDQAAVGITTTITAQDLHFVVKQPAPDAAVAK